MNRSGDRKEINCYCLDINTILASKFREVQICGRAQCGLSEIILNVLLQEFFFTNLVTAQAVILKNVSHNDNLGKSLLEINYCDINDSKEQIKIDVSSINLIFNILSLYLGDGLTKINYKNKTDFCFILWP